MFSVGCVSVLCGLCVEFAPKARHEKQERKYKTHTAYIRVLYFALLFLVASAATAADELDGTQRSLR